MPDVKKINIVKRSFQNDRTIERKEIADWEAKSGFVLPNDYKDFILRWNGGTIYPYGFTVKGLKIDDLLKCEHLGVEIFEDWDAVLSESEIEQPSSISMIPSEHLLIGSELYDEFHILLCLTDDVHGSIRIGFQSRHQSWDERLDEEKILVTVAPCFSEFINNIGRSSIDELYHSFWNEDKIKSASSNALEF